MSADKPSAPQGPLEVIETTPSAITLHWNPPTDDGGVSVDHYLLETKPSGSDEWTKRPVRIEPDETKGTVDDLDKGQEYDFRVVAINSQGQSEPLVTAAPIKAKYPFGKVIIRSCYIRINGLFVWQPVAGLIYIK